MSTKMILFDSKKVFSAKKIAIRDSVESIEAIRTREERTRNNNYYGYTSLAYKACSICSIPINNRTFPGLDNIPIFAISRTDIRWPSSLLVCVNCFEALFCDLSFKEFRIDGHINAYSRYYINSRKYKTETIDENDERLTCMYCDYDFRQTENTNRHFATIHQVDDELIVRHSSNSIYPEKRYDYSTSSYVNVDGMCLPKLYNLGIVPRENTGE